jgi:hypothetical protein
MKSFQVKRDNTMAKSKTAHFHSSKMMMTMMGDENEDKSALKKISVMHVIKLGFAPVSFPPG